jgi:hypothetical protein
MQMFDSPRPEILLKTRPFFAHKSAALIAMAVVALAVGLASGCKQQASVQQPVARTDQQITSDVQAKIQGESALAGQNVQVSVANGVATLSGTVSDDASRALAGNDSGTINGVRTVVNNLTVQPVQQASAPAPAPTPRKETRHDRPSRQQTAAPAPQPVQQPAMSAPPAPVQTAAATPAPAPAPPRPVVQQITLDSGTAIPVTLTEALDSKTAQPDDVFHATLAGDLIANGVVAVPRGAQVLGRVVEVKEAAHFKGSALLTIELTQLTTRGRKITLVTDTFSKTGAGRGKNTAVKAGGGAALGAIIGAIAGGGKGAAIGAAAGAGAGTGVNAVTRGEQAQIPSESRLEFRLQAPITVSVSTPSGRMEYERPADPQLQQR